MARAAVVLFLYCVQALLLLPAPVKNGVAGLQVASPNSIFRHGLRQGGGRWRPSLVLAGDKGDLGERVQRLKDRNGWALTDGDEAVLQGYWQGLQSMCTYLDPAQLDRVAAALEVAYQAHSGQSRKSGEPYIEHPLAVTKILAGLELESDALVAGLLHDTVEDTSVSLPNIEEAFGTTVARIVEGDTKVSKLTKSKIGDRDIRPALFEDAQAENLRQMLLAMAEDWRVLIVKLADRMHNMRTLGAMVPAKQRRIAQETLDVFAPLAHRLGAWVIKRELEDRAFRILEPRLALAIRQAIRKKRREFFSLFTECKRLELQLRLDPILEPDLGWARVKVESKGVYDLWRKLKREQGGFNGTIDGIDDAISLQIIFERKLEKKSKSHAENLAADAAYCYSALEAVHALYPPCSPPRVKDYVAFPKSNGYTALHSIVLVQGRPIEVQIRSRDMDKLAQVGMVATWAPESSPMPRLPWLSALVEETCGEECEVGMDSYRSEVSSLQLPSVAATNPTSASDFAKMVRRGLSAENSFVETPSGQVLNLRENSTVGHAMSELLATHGYRPGFVLDPALRHPVSPSTRPGIPGVEVVASKVNGRVVDLATPLRHGHVLSMVTKPIAASELPRQTIRLWSWGDEQPVWDQLAEEDRFPAGNGAGLLSGTNTSMVMQLAGSGITSTPFQIFVGLVGQPEEEASTLLTSATPSPIGLSSAPPSDVFLSPSPFSSLSQAPWPSPVALASTAPSRRPRLAPTSLGRSTVSSSPRRGTRPYARRYSRSPEGASTTDPPPLAVRLSGETEAPGLLTTLASPTETVRRVVRRSSLVSTFVLSGLALLSLFTVLFGTNFPLEPPTAMIGITGAMAMVTAITVVEFAI
eukprot:CAMPEP_0118976106 /NCGR_PEP_ID=MMETSP1173-20130426/17861_1 /TAXON_ID=1034831 /ORGANISM="Rhizochromulina marina cf, Strain CCMP1243" /LENGTH=867 /DNA_ID=CAMNT_0006926101 /DNA_START=35 /DNA_END=2635 /DNA_ORIENTATION=-